MKLDKSSNIGDRTLTSAEAFGLSVCASDDAMNHKMPTARASFGLFAQQSLDLLMMKMYATIVVTGRRISLPHSLHGGARI